MHPLLTAYMLYAAQFDKEPVVDYSYRRAIWLAHTIVLSEWWNTLRRLPHATR